MKTQLNDLMDGVVEQLAAGTHSTRKPCPLTGWVTKIDLLRLNLLYIIVIVIIMIVIGEERTKVNKTKAF